MSVRSRWLEELAKRSRRAAEARRRYIWHPTTANRRELIRAREAVAFAQRVLKRHPAGRPRIYRHGQAGISRPTRSFGELGQLRVVTAHHAAGPRAATSTEAIGLNRSYDQAHRAKGWGGLGYMETIDDAGNLYVSYRATGLLKGAHVGGENTGNYGILIHGNYETDQPTAKALATLRWRLEHGHTAGLPDLRGLPVKGHRDWPAHKSNACPGRNLYSKLRSL